MPLAASIWLIKSSDRDSLQASFTHLWQVWPTRSSTLHWSDQKRSSENSHAVIAAFSVHSHAEDMPSTVVSQAPTNQSPVISVKSFKASHSVLAAPENASPTSSQKSTKSVSNQWTMSSVKN